MASAARSGNVRLWLWAQQVCLFSLIAHNGVVEDLDFNVDGSLLATCGSGGKIKVTTALLLLNVNVLSTGLVHWRLLPSSPNRETRMWCFRS